jgi:hypothetical protein
MKTEIAVSSKTLVSIYQTEQHHITVECTRNLDINFSDNIKSRNILTPHSKIKRRRNLCIWYTLLAQSHFCNCQSFQQ